MMRARASQRSSALLITLVFMVLITIVLVGFLSSMRINRPAAYLYMERNQASFYAQNGIASALSTLDQIVLHTNQTWLSQPGQLMILSGTGSTTSLLAVPLSSSTNSGLIPSSLSSYPAPDLNIASSRDSTDHIISNTGGSLYLNWIYVTQDATRSQYLSAANSFQWQANPAFNPTTTNPVVGRFAYWTDDESTKININTAWGRGDASNSNLLSSPTMVDLTSLSDSTNQITQAMANGLHAYITTNNYAILNNPFYDSPAQARQLVSSAAAIKHFKGELTSYNHDPGLNMFGQPRFVLTTRPDRAGWTYNGTTWVGQNGLSGDPGTVNAGTPYYLRVLANEGTINAPDSISGSLPNVATDPGLPGMSFGNYSATHLNNTMNTLVSYLTNTGWPVASNSTNSFLTKFYPTGSNTAQGQYPNAAVANARCAQLALDIIEYVCSKESPQQIVVPMRVNETVTSSSSTYSFFTSGNLPQGNTFFGSTRAPQITEVGAWFPDGSTLGYMLGYIEMYNPVNYGIVGYSTANITGYMEDSSVTKVSQQYGASYIIPSGTSTTMNPGDYKVVRIIRTFSGGLSFSPRPTQYPARFYLGIGIAGDYIAFAPYGENFGESYGTNPTACIEVPVDAVGGSDPLYTTPSIQTVEIDDPRLSSHTGAWHLHPFMSGGVNNSLNAQDSYYLTNTDLVSSPLAQQDTTSSGTLSDASFYMPPPAGTTIPISYYTSGCPVNPLGYVTSLGELGYVHTGIETDTVSFSNPTSTSTTTLVSMPVGTPWRTLRLQPNNNANTQVVPDWALLDLFAVPATYNPQGTPVLNPYGNTTGGRVNINTSLQPTNFDSGRIMPLQAVFQGATNSFATGTTNSISTAQQLSSNIANYVLSPTSVNGAGKDYPTTATTAYITPGQIAEIQGVSDSGESSEDNFRQVIGQLCARGDVFTVYSVGQALKVSPGGTINVTGEQRLQTMVERRQDPSTGNVTVRTVYYRSVVP
jgi:hypothetical protein